MNKTRYTIIILLFSLILNSCRYEVKIPMPDKITAVINGEEFRDLSLKQAKYKMAFSEAAKAVASTLVTLSKEEYTREQVLAMMNEQSNAFNLEYKQIVEMKIWVAAGYTRKVQFKNIYVIHKEEKRMVFFFLPSQRIYKPYVPLSDSARAY